MCVCVLWCVDVRPAFGHDPKFVGMALFFDTYDNDAESKAHKHPYVSAMINDGTLEYQHDDLAGVPVGDGHPDNGCHARIRQYGLDEKVVTARISYDGRKRTLSVKLLFSRDATMVQSRPPYEWTQCTTIHDVYLPPGYYLGVSASTGDLSDRHDVVGLEVFAEEGAAHAVAPADQPVLPSVGVANELDESFDLARFQDAKVEPPSTASPSLEDAKASAEAAARGAMEDRQPPPAAATRGAASRSATPPPDLTDRPLSEDEKRALTEMIGAVDVIERLATEGQALNSALQKLGAQSQQRVDSTSSACQLQQFNYLLTIVVFA